MSSTREISDDNIKLEPKVVLALSRLSKLNKLKRPTGVACQQIVEYLIANYCNLDGDVESQVLTALLSCIKKGIVCALVNGKYRLSGPGSKGIVSKCISRSVHGPKCSCSTAIRRISKTFQNACCLLKISNNSSRKGRKATAKSRPSSRQPKKRTVSKAKPKKCADRMLEEGDSCSAGVPESESVCNFCLEAHPVQSSSSQGLCTTCHLDRMGFVAPIDKFSPREERM